MTTPALCATPPFQGGETPLLGEEGWREAPGWSYRSFCAKPFLKNQEWYNTKVPQIIVEDLVKTFQVASRAPGLWGSVRGLVTRSHRTVHALDRV